MRSAHDNPEIGLVALGFSPADRLAALARHLGWTEAFLTDPQRACYARLGLGRAPLWQVYSAGTLLRYARAARSGQKLARPVEDTRQMGGDAIIRDGRVVRRWLPRSPDDRVSVAELLAAAAGYLR